MMQDTICHRFSLLKDLVLRSFNFLKEDSYRNHFSFYLLELWIVKIF